MQRVFGKVAIGEQGSGGITLHFVEVQVSGEQFPSSMDCWRFAEYQIFRLAPKKQAFTSSYLPGLRQFATSMKKPQPAKNDFVRPVAAARISRGTLIHPKCGTNALPQVTTGQA